jgi:outer membrane protein assembly factor BamB
MGVVMMGLKRVPRLRWAVAGICALVLLAGVGVVAWRVLRPAATLDRAGGPVPVPVAAAARWYGALPSAPLILDGRLRVYAEKRRVWSDTPVTDRHPASPYWAYRRWPAQVVGVVAIDGGPADGRPLVVARWSDGTVTGIDALAGTVAWQKRIAPTDDAGYIGRRTGARTVYDPPGLYTATGHDGTPVLIVAGDNGVAGYDPANGRPLWTRPERCAAAGWTGGSTYVARCGDRLDILDAETGRQLGTWTGPSPQPWGCALGHSGCPMVATAGGASFRIGRDGTVTAAPAAHSATDHLVDGGYVESRDDSYVRVVDADTGAQRWQRPLRGRVVGTDGTRVYVLTPDFRLVTLDAASGVEQSRSRLPATAPWHPGYVYVNDGFVVLERLRGQPRSSDDNYYYSAAGSVVVAGG